MYTRPLRAQQRKAVGNKGFQRGWAVTKEWLLAQEQHHQCYSCRRPNAAMPSHGRQRPWTAPSPLSATTTVSVSHQMHVSASASASALVSSASRLPRAPTFALRWLRLDPPLPTRFRAAKAIASDTHWLSTPSTWRRPVCSGTAARLFVASPRHRPDVFAWPACSVDPATCREGSTTVVAASWCLLNTLAAETAIVCYSCM